MKRLAAALTTAGIIILAHSTLQADNSFYRVLASKSNATVEDAVRAFLEMSLEIDATNVPFDRQAQALLDMRVIREDWIKDPKTKLTRGRAACMILRTCGIRGGLTLRLTGSSERYAFRECAFIGVWGAQANQRDYMSGNELMGVLKWAADYVEEHPGRKVRPSGSAVRLREEVSAGAAGTSPDKKPPAPK